MNKVFFPEEFSLWRSCPRCWSGSALWPTTAWSCSCFQLSELKTLSNSHIHNSHPKSSEVEEENLSWSLLCCSSKKKRAVPFQRVPGVKCLCLSCDVSPPRCISCRKTVPYWSRRLQVLFIQFWALLSAAAPSETRPWITGNREKFQGVLRIPI